MPIRHAIAADIPSLMDLAAHAATAAQWTQRQYEDAISALQPRRLTLVLEETNVVGFLVARTSDHEWELENIAVDQAARRHGLGTRLLSELMRLARQEGAESLFLEVRESNQAAHALYEKCGFSRAGRRPKYYTGPTEDAIIYRRFLL